MKKRILFLVFSILIALPATSLASFLNLPAITSLNPTPTINFHFPSVAALTAQDSQNSTESASTDSSSTSEVSTSTKGFEDFKDVPINDPDYNAILLLRYNGVISGYPDNTFHPNDPISRVEALKLIFVASNLQALPGVGPASFSDTENDTWYTPYLNRAVFLQIVSGYPDNTFKPAQTVNKVEFLKMLILANKVDLSKLNLLELPFTDAIPGQWYSKYLMYAKFFKLLDADSKNNVSPGAPLTRGEAAQLIFRFRNLPESTRLAPDSGTSSDSTSGTTSDNQTASAPANLIPNFALFVSKSALFAIQYPKNWFYQIAENNIVDPNDPYYSEITKTYYFGPDDLSFNPPKVTMEILTRTAAFQGDSTYNQIPYYKTTSPDGKKVIIMSPPNSKRLYRFSYSDATLEQNVLDMMSTVTEQIDGMESYPPAPAN